MNVTFISKMKNGVRGFVCLSMFLFAVCPLFAGNETNASAGNAYQYYLRALLLESQGNFQMAREEIERAIQEAPDSGYLYKTQAELSLRLGQVNRAAEEIEKANELDPDNVKALILGGQINWAIGDTDKAEEKLKKAVKLAPDEAEAIVSLAGTLTPTNPDEAIKLYKNYLQRHPGDVDIWERLAQIYQSLNKLKEAEKAWEKTLDWAPTSIRAHLALAQIAEVNKDTTTAIKHYETVMADNPANLPLLLRIGELRYRNNDMAKAYDAFSKAKALAPESAAANFWMALLAENRGDWNEAIELLEKVSTGQPDAGVYLRLSYYYSQVRRFSDAVKILEKLVAFQPANTDFLNYLAIAYEQNNMIAQAEKTLKRILEIDTSNHETHFQLATLYDRSKKFDLAEKELKEAIQLKPDYHMALNYLGYSYADRGIKLDEAEALLNDAVGMDPENPAYLDSLGWLYFRQGKLQKAQDFLKEATRRARDPLIFEHLGDVEQAKGNPVEAALAWNDSLAIDPSKKSVAKKIQKILKKMPLPLKLNFFMKRAIIQYSDIRHVNSLIEIDLCVRFPCIRSKAQFSYVKGEELRIEIPGPLSGPVMLLTKKPNSPAQYGALHPQFQMAEPYATQAFSKVEQLLSAQIFRDADLSKLELKQSGAYLRGTSESLNLIFYSKSGDLKRIEWIQGDHVQSLEVKKADDALPSEMDWKDSESGIKLGIEFIRPVVSTFSDVATSDAEKQ